MFPYPRAWAHPKSRVNSTLVGNHRHRVATSDPFHHLAFTRPGFIVASTHREGSNSMGRRLLSRSYHCKLLLEG